MKTIEAIKVAESQIDKIQDPLDKELAIGMLNTAFYVSEDIRFKIICAVWKKININKLIK